MAGTNILVPRLAHVGLLARSTSDLCLFASAFDPVLADVLPAIRPPRLDFVRGPAWAMAESDACAAFEALLEALQTTIVTVDVPGAFDDALDITIGLLNAHLALRFGAAPDETRRRYCRPLQEGIEAGRSIDTARYLALDALADRLVEGAACLFDELDALITLSAPGEATRLEDGPGSGVMSMPRSLCGLPTVSLPLLTGSRGLPIGVQLIGPTVAMLTCCASRVGSRLWHRRIIQHS
jgi:Asp-tRNA(Asn)/Glu-tRNA(Gln) amidotransferase A subunit family amidase